VISSALKITKSHCLLYEVAAITPETRLRYCNSCRKQLSVTESGLFVEDDFAVCRDCWINQNFEPTN